MEVFKIILRHKCPICGNSFCTGIDNRLGIDYITYSITMSKYDSIYGITGINDHICETCYDKIYGFIESLERRERNEQPKIP